MIQTLQLVSQQMSHTLNRILRTDYHHAVTDLQRQLTGRKQIHTGTVDAGNVHSVHTAEMQFSQSFSVDVRLCHQNTA